MKWLRVVLAAAALVASSCAAQELDLILRGGSVIDGSGSAAVRADVGIAGDRIVLVGSSAGRKANPTVLATGVRYLTVNGRLAVDGGVLAEAQAGRALRR